MVDFPRKERTQLGVGLLGVHKDWNCDNLLSNACVAPLAVSWRGLAAIYTNESDDVFCISICGYGSRLKGPCLQVNEGENPFVLVLCLALRESFAMEVPEVCFLFFSRKFCVRVVCLILTPDD